MKKIAIFFVIIVLLTGCSSIPSTWDPLFPVEIESNKDFEKIWTKVVASVSENYDIAILEKESGYLQSNWIEKRDFLGNKEYRTRITIRTKNKSPLQMEIKAEKQKWNTFTNEWISKGNDPDLEDKIRNNIYARISFN